MIRQYSLAKDGNHKLAPSFNTREFRCRDGTDTILVDEALTVVLRCIRDHFGKSVTITSGYGTRPNAAGYERFYCNPIISLLEKL